MEHKSVAEMVAETRAKLRAQRAANGARRTPARELRNQSWLRALNENRTPRIDSLRRILFAQEKALLAKEPPAQALARRRALRRALNRGFPIELLTEENMRGLRP